MSLYSNSFFTFDDLAEIYAKDLSSLNVLYNQSFAPMISTSFQTTVYVSTFVFISFISYFILGEASPVSESLISSSDSLAPQPLDFYTNYNWNGTGFYRPQPHCFSLDLIPIYNCSTLSDSFWMDGYSASHPDSTYLCDNFDSCVTSQFVTSLLFHIFS